MAKKDLTLSSKILITILGLGHMFLITPRELRRRSYSGRLLGDDESFVRMLYYLTQKGYLKFVNKDNQRFIKITKHGELKALVEKARLANKPKVWDGKWRVVIFDIPEDSYEKRDFFRYLLKQNGFKQLQASVYVSPYPLNREAIAYLQETKLIDYIRILKVEEMDNDKDLRKKFELKV